MSALCIWCYIFNNLNLDSKLCKEDTYLVDLADNSRDLRRTTLRENIILVYNALRKKIFSREVKKKFFDL